MDDELQQEVILRQMEQTRASLSEKLETLEQQVTDKVQGATEAVTGTVETVTDAVKDTVNTVKDTMQDTVEAVKSAFDLQEHMDRHPWLVLGGAVAAGYAAGWLLGNMGGTAEEASSGLPVMGRAPSRQAEAPSGPSWLAGLTSTFGSELGKLKGLALGTLFGVVRDVVQDQLPAQIKPQVNELFDSVTSKLGGQPMREPLLHADNGSRREEARGNGAYGPATPAV